MKPADVLLRVEGLATEFATRRGPVRAVNDVSFEVGHGQVLGIVGESGSGKSVTARSIMRMVRPPGQVTAGQVWFEGQDLRTLTADQMRRLRGDRIAMIFQDPQAVLNPVLRVGDQIAEALTVRGHDRAAAGRRAVELLEQVGIPDPHRRYRDYPHQFSGGMRQRAVIAIALANEPALLIADEPTTALDVTIQAQILRMLVRLREEIGVAIIMITHDMGVVAELCSDVVVMYGGRVVEQGTVVDVFAQPRHPYTAALLAAMPRLDAATGARHLPAIPGTPPDPAALPAGCAFHPRCAYVEPRCHEQLPALRQVGAPGQHAACWVAPAPSRSTPVGDSTPVREPVGEVPVLELVDLRTDVGSQRRGLLGRTPPVYAVDGVSLRVHAGETLGLVGESGCGKSTLSRTVVGLQPPAAGSVLVGERDVSAMGPRELAHLQSTVQYVFQDPYASLNPRRTVRQSLQEALAVRGVPRARQADELRGLVARVGLDEHHLDRYPRAFSGGQRQRIGIARALARAPRLLICDEPVSALDVSIQAQIINLLVELRDQLGLGYLFIAHDLSVVRHLSDRIAVMYLGRIVETGPAEAVYQRPQHPYTVALLSSSPVPDPAERQRERIVLPGDLPSPAAPPSGCRFRTRCPIGPLANPDRTICAEVDPPPQPTTSGTTVACHFAGELAMAAAGRE